MRHLLTYSLLRPTKFSQGELRRESWAAVAVGRVLKGGVV